MRLRVRALAVILSLVGWTVATAQVTVRVDLPQQSLADSLRAFASQTNINILFDPPLVAGRQAPALKAQLSLEEALTRLLAGSGIRYVFLNENTVVLAPAGGSGASVKPPDAAKESLQSPRTGAVLAPDGWFSSWEGIRPPGPGGKLGDTADRRYRHLRYCGLMRV